jgi:MinD-like ATPase involved in chromosome partitioning or flagellar assembly
MAQDMHMKILVAGDEEAVCQQVRSLLVRDGLDCPQSHVVPWEVAKDRAGRLNPALVVLALGSDHERSLHALREICQTTDSYTVVIGPTDNSKLILRLDYISLRSTRRMMEYLKQLGLDLERVLLVINRYGERQQLSLAAAEESLGKKILHSIPNDPSQINAAINAGSPVYLRRPFAKISRRLGSLADSVNGQHTISKSPRSFIK